MNTVRDGLKRLRIYPDDVQCAVVIWLLDDIYWKADESNIVLTKEEAEYILDQLHTRHDAQVGINWGVIDDLIFDVVYDRPENVLSRSIERAFDMHYKPKVIFCELGSWTKEEEKAHAAIRELGFALTMDLYVIKEGSWSWAVDAGRCAVDRGYISIWRDYNVE